MKLVDNITRLLTHEDELMEAIQDIVLLGIIAGLLALIPLGLFQAAQLAWWAVTAAYGALFG